MLQKIFTYYKRSFCTARCRNSDHPAVIVYGNKLLVSGTKRHIDLPGIVHDEESLLALVPARINELFLTDSVQTISLIISPIFFAYTAFELSGVEQNQLRDALQLQLPMLLPGCADNDLLAYMDFNCTDETGSALWMKSSLADRLVDALLQYNFYLEKIIPRPVAFFEGAAVDIVVEDKDSHQQTLVELSDKKINSWYSICGSDLENETFLDEYNVHKADAQKKKINGEERLLLTISDTSVREYTCDTDVIFFIPHKYNQIVSKIKKKKSLKVVSLLLVLSLCALSYPFATLFFDHKSLQKKILKLKDVNADIITLSQSIQEFKEKWSILDDFPDVDVFNLLTFLNTLIPRDSWLISVTLDNGLLEITGYSPDPDKILQILSEQEMFAEVAYSQVVRAEQESGEYNYFGIECEIREVDILSYLDTYFQDDHAY